jgi:peptidoglycan hydrolase-like protein with peptidoglycan-binding domain
MKKSAILILVALVTLPVISLAQTQTGAVDPRGLTKSALGKVVPSGYCFNILSQGARGPEVEDLQTILKSDPTIYPEGLVTSYYGPLTKKAIQKLQKKFNLPQTGNVDEDTARIILPCPIDIKLTVVSPNGGEVWDRKDVHEITWKLSRADGMEPLTSQEITTNFFWPRGRIDLLKSDGSFVRHIANVNLAWQSYDWQINPSIPNRADYKIRIGVGPVLGCEGERCPSAWHPKFTFGDESDDPFSITGAVTPPIEGVKIQEAINILQTAIQQLQKLLSLLESML